MQYLRLRNYVRFGLREIPEPTFLPKYRRVVADVHVTNVLQNLNSVELLEVAEASEQIH